MIKESLPLENKTKRQRKKPNKQTRSKPECMWFLCHDLAQSQHCRKMQREHKLQNMYACSNTAGAQRSAGSKDLISSAFSSVPVTCTFRVLFNSHLASKVKSK